MNAVSNPLCTGSWTRVGAKYVRFILIRIIGLTTGRDLFPVLSGYSSRLTVPLLERNYCA